jgi:hypothetical protein
LALVQASDRLHCTDGRSHTHQKRINRPCCGIQQRLPLNLQNAAKKSCRKGLLIDFSLQEVSPDPSAALS